GTVTNTSEWKYLGDGWEGIDEAQRSRDDADWYLVHLGLNEFRITIPWKTEYTIEGDETAAVPGPYKIVYDETASISKFTSPAKVEVYYEAAVTPSATIGVSDSTNLYNTAYASWGVAHDVLSTGTDRVVTTTYGLGIVKEDAANHENLPGAVFKIYRDEALTKPVYVIPTNIEGVYMVDSKGSASEDISGIIFDNARELYGTKTPADVEKLNKYLNGAAQRNEVVSPVNGRIVILGLDKGEYYIEETDAPEGYNPVSKPQKMDIGDENLTNFIIFADSEGNVKEMVQPENGYTEYSYNIAYTVIQNSKGMALPSTGGEGTFWLITIGTLIAICFAVFLITHKKMSVYTD
ncbi:MAG: LPXTG cell wall anchor domain-containing protein, partial [Clostridia bacterium]|nr:LPXTG cell wall anchor domain-containing protein [Clostridia bacterium]